MSKTSFNLSFAFILSDIEVKSLSRNCLCFSASTSYCSISPCCATVKSFALFLACTNASACDLAEETETFFNSCVATLAIFVTSSIASPTSLPISLAACKASVPTSIKAFLVSCMSSVSCFILSASLPPKTDFSHANCTCSTANLIPKKATLKGVIAIFSTLLIMRPSASKFSVDWLTDS